jgi:hypothetical protein
MLIPTSTGAISLKPTAPRGVITIDFPGSGSYVRRVARRTSSSMRQDNLFGFIRTLVDQEPARALVNVA